MKLLLVLLLYVNIGFAQNPDDITIENFNKKIDSIKYTASDFLKMQQYFTNRKDILMLMNNKSKDGDENAFHFQKILSLNYDIAIKQYGEFEIKTLIFSYYQSLKTLEEFDKLNTDFQKQIDSLKSQKEWYETEIKDEKRMLDSIIQLYKIEIKNSSKN